MESHLFDTGFSLRAGRRRATGHLCTSATASDFLRDAQALAEGGVQRYEVLIPCLLNPHGQTLAAGGPAFRPRSQARDWLARDGHHPLPGLDGAFCFAVEPRDPFAAADQARELAERLLARDVFGVDKKSLELADSVYAEGIGASLPLTRESRPVVSRACTTRPSSNGGGRAGKVRRGARTRRAAEPGPDRSCRQRHTDRC